MNLFSFLKNAFAQISMLFIALTITNASADYSNIPSSSFSSESSLHEEEFEKISPILVSIGDAGNLADTTGVGAVESAYQIGKNRVTVKEYTTFLNAVGKHDLHSLYNPEMGKEGANLIIQTVENECAEYKAVEGKENESVTFVSFLSVLRYCNWLHHNQPSGEQNNLTTEDGAYTLRNSFYTAFNPNAGARYFLPNNNQWYKAAFYAGGSTKAAYLFSSHKGYGASDMRSNCLEWTSSISAPNNSERLAIVCGGEKQYWTAPLSIMASAENIGFRIAAPALDPVTSSAAEDAIIQIENKSPATAGIINHQALKWLITLLIALLANKFFASILGYALTIAAVVAFILAFGPAIFTSFGLEGAAVTLDAVTAGISSFFSSGAAAEGASTAGNAVIGTANMFTQRLSRFASSTAHQIEDVAQSQFPATFGAPQTEAHVATESTHLISTSAR